MAKIRELEFHPIANKYPMMNTEQFSRFVEHMQKEGYDRKQPVILYEGKILDRRNTYLACKQLNIEPEFQDWNGECGTPEKFCRMRNLYRNHYEKDVLAAIAAAEHEENKHGHGAKKANGKSAKDVAKDHGISETKLHDAKRKLKGATKSVREAVVNGKASLDDAQKVSTLPKEVQDEAARRVSEGHAETLQDAAVGEAWEGQDEPLTAPQTDQVGKRVPKHLGDIFATTMFSKYLQHIRELRKLTEALRKESPYLLEASDTLKKLEAIEERCKNAAVHAVCPDCRGVQKDGKTGCESCRYVGWVPEWRYDEMMFGVTA